MQEERDRDTWENIVKQKIFFFKWRGGGIIRNGGGTQRMMEGKKMVKSWEKKGTENGVGGEVAVGHEGNKDNGLAHAGVMILIPLICPECEGQYWLEASWSLARQKWNNGKTGRASGNSEPRKRAAATWVAAPFYSACCCLVNPSNSLRSASTNPHTNPRKFFCQSCCMLYFTVALNKRVSAVNAYKTAGWEINYYKTCNCQS